MRSFAPSNINNHQQRTFLLFGNYHENRKRLQQLVEIVNKHLKGGGIVAKVVQGYEEELPITSNETE